MRILVISATAHPGHETRNLAVATELTRRGFEVRHTGPSTRMNDGFFVWSTFQPEFELRPDAQEAGTRLFDSWQDLFVMIAWADIILFGTGKGYGEAGCLARRLGKLVIQHHDIGGLDSHHAHPDVFLVRGPWDRDSVQARPSAFSSRFLCAPIITGCVQFDDIFAPRPADDRENFFRKYGLDPKRKVLTYLSCSPGNHNARYVETQRRIIDSAIDQAGFQVIVKPHPSDYAGAKLDRAAYGRDAKASWDHFHRPVAVAEACDKHACFRHSDVIVSRGSTAALETPLVGKPMVMVDMAELAIEGNFDPRPIKTWWHGRRFSGIGRRPFQALGDREADLDRWPEGPERDYARQFQTLCMRQWGIAPEYIGGECTLEELPEILLGDAYRFDDAEVYRAYLERYHPFTDGLSQGRIADAIERVLQQPGIGDKARRAARHRSWHGALVTLTHAGRKLRRRLGAVSARLRGKA
jgi:hypothetical protein